MGSPGGRASAGAGAGGGEGGAASSGRALALIGFSRSGWVRREGRWRKDGARDATKGALRVSDLWGFVPAAWVLSRLSYPDPPPPRAPLLPGWPGDHYEGTAHWVQAARALTPGTQVPPDTPPPLSPSILGLAGIPHRCPPPRCDMPTRGGSIHAQQPHRSFYLQARCESPPSRSSLPGHPFQIMYPFQTITHTPSKRWSILRMPVPLSDQVPRGGRTGCRVLPSVLSWETRCRLDLARR